MYPPFFFLKNENITIGFLKNMTLNIKVTLVRTDVHFDPLPGELYSLTTYVYRKGCSI